MKFPLNRLAISLIAVILYLAVCVLSTVIIKPFSILSFIGPAAGIATAFTIAWGGITFFSIVIATIFFIYFLQYYGEGSVIEPAVIIISTLAIFLQAYIAKLLTLRFVPKQKWLNNRASLVQFMALIGPVAATISALASLLVSVLDNQHFDSISVYTFVVSFSGSILVATFITPLLLFTQGKQKLTLSKRLYITMVSVLVCVAVALLFKVSEQEDQYQRVKVFNQYKNTMLAALNQDIAQISDQLSTVTALFKASEFVSVKEFNAFTQSLFKHSMSIRTIEWIPIVSNENKLIFEIIATEQLNKKYLVVERSPNVAIKKAEERDFYAPIYYVYPYGNDATYGYDLLMHETQRLAMDMAAKLNHPVATPPQEIVESDFYQPKMRVYYPVYSDDIQQSFGRYTTPLNNDIAGFVAAQVQFSQFFELLALENKPNNIQLIVEDVSVNTPFFVYGEYVPMMNRLSETVSVEFFSRHWKVTFYEDEVWLLQGKTWRTWSTLLGGSFSAVIFQLLFLMVAVYSNELTHKVNLKTQELIDEKELAEKENLAKTELLQTLSTELNTPFKVIKKLTETFPTKNLDEVGKNFLANISAAGFNLGRMIDTLSEVSSIGAGKLNISKQPFNFIEFIHRMERTLTVRREDSDAALQFTIANSTPLFINSDELRLQQLFIALAENAEGILACDGVSISIKAHLHRHDKATIFFVITPVVELSEQSGQMLSGVFDDSIGRYNSQIAMVKELCIVFGGDLKLARLPSSNMMLSASIKVDVHQFTQQNEGSNFITQTKNIIDESKNVILVQNSVLSDNSLMQNLLALGYQVELMEVGENINFVLNQQGYHGVVFDESLPVEEMLLLGKALKEYKQHNHIIVIAILPATTSANVIKELKKYISFFDFSSLPQDRLAQLLHKDGDL